MDVFSGVHVFHFTTNFIHFSEGFLFIKADEKRLSEI